MSGGRKPTVHEEAVRDVVGAACTGGVLVACVEQWVKDGETDLARQASRPTMGSPR